MMEECPAGRLCPWFEPVLAVPPEWAIDPQMSKENKIVFLLPRGKTLETAKVRIYGRAFLNKETMSIEDRVRVDGERWKQESPHATAERLPDVQRAKGGAFQIYRYRNPDRKAQPVELTAFGDDSDAQGNRFGVLIVLTATSEASLAQTEAAYRTLLSAY